jgi:hypothetical protein
VSAEPVRIRPWWLATAAVALGVVALATIGLFAWAIFQTGSATHTYTIEAGTGARIDAGEVIELMPTEVRMKVGDTLVIRNDDEREFMVGPYLVRAGEVLEQTFQRPQILIGECSLSGSGEIRIIVT